jgi:hypothetical protein
VPRCPPGGSKSNCSSAGSPHAHASATKVLRRASEGSGGSSSSPSNKDPNKELDEYVEVKVENVRASQGASVVYLRVVGSESVVMVHVGESESNALLREMNKQRQVRGQSMRVGGRQCGVGLFAAAIHGSTPITLQHRGRRGLVPAISAACAVGSSASHAC